MTHNDEPADKSKNKPSGTFNGNIAENEIDEKTRERSTQQGKPRDKRTPPPKPTLWQRWKKTSISNKIVALCAIVTAVAGSVYAGVEFLKFAYPLRDPTEIASISVHSVNGIHCDSTANTFYAEIHLHNDGKTDAINVRSIARAALVTDNAEPTEPSLKDAPMRGNIGPGVFVTIPITPNNLALDKKLLDICRHIKTLPTYILGVMQYSDINHCNHWLKYKFVYRPRQDSFEPMTMSRDDLERCER